jgi:dihydrofolate reductase
MIKVKVFFATSLDGFIAREDGDIDWLQAGGHGEVDEAEDFGYEAFMCAVDALVMGRNTYEKVLSFGETWPHENKAVIVLTSRGIQIPKELKQTVFTLSGSPEEIKNTLANRGYSQLYLDGGKTIQRFLADGLVDKMTITQIPILIGNGIPLFGSLPKDIQLELKQSK